MVDHFDVRDHLHRYGAPAPYDLGGVLELAGIFAEDAFDRSQPLWQFAVVDGLTGGRAACIIKLHHAITDGVGGLRLLAKFADFTRDAPPHESTAAPAPDRPVPPLVVIEGAASTAAQGRRTVQTVPRHWLVRHSVSHATREASYARPRQRFGPSGASFSRSRTRCHRA